MFLAIVIASALFQAVAALPTGAGPAEEHMAVRARGEQLMADLQQAACGFNGQSFSSLTKATPATDWTFADSNKTNTWCVEVC